MGRGWIGWYLRDMISCVAELLKLTALPLNNNGYGMLVSRACGIVFVRLTSCGMMDSLERRSLSPIAAISMLHNGQLGLRTNVIQRCSPINIDRTGCQLYNAEQR